MGEERGEGARFLPLILTFSRKGEKELGQRSIASHCSLCGRDIDRC
jgi:hypothetical protein